jgi:hypothetical protein
MPLEGKRQLLELTLSVTLPALRWPNTACTRTLQRTPRKRRGTIDEYLRQQMTDETDAEYWQYLCEYLWCPPVAEISAVEQISIDEFVFSIVFMQQDGTRLEIGACCGGDPAATPPVWQFAYPVQKIDGEWKVMRGPIFTP